jgi:alpha/beta superfamily hydrolase
MEQAAPRAERITLEGPAGVLETLIESAVGAEAPRAFGVVCHPHPLYGGNLDNKVTWALARAFGQAGAPTIRFNFRGVGASAGRYDEARGETADALGVIAYGRSRWPQAQLWLAGFSFGAVVALRAARESHAALLVTVAPGITKIEPGAGTTPAIPWLVVQGDADDVVPATVVLPWARSLTPPPTVQVIAGAGHFFHGRINELRDTVAAFINAHPPS